jgi:hypothetical protein
LGKQKDSLPKEQYKIGFGERLQVEKPGQKDLVERSFMKIGNQIEIK